MFLRKLHQVLGFTPAETRIVIFLLVTLMAGAAIRIVQTMTNSVPAFDYRVSDSIFAARSRLLNEQETPVSGGGNRVLERGEQAAKSTGELSPASIDLNRAGRTELEKLPGIGEAMARRIISYREEHGPFRRISDLENVKGIGKKKLARLAPFCRIGR